VKGRRSQKEDEGLKSFVRPAVHGKCKKGRGWKGEGKMGKESRESRCLCIGRWVRGGGGAGGGGVFRYS